MDINELQKQLENLQKQNDILMSIAPKAQLQRRLPKDAIGMTIKVPTYRRDSEDEASLVVGWSLTKDHVRANSRTGEIEETQTVVVRLEGSSGSLNFLEAKLKKLTDPEKIEACKLEIKKAKEGLEIEMSLLDFGRDIEKEQVSVLSDKTSYGRDGQPKEFFFLWKGEEKSILTPFIN